MNVALIATEVQEEIPNSSLILERMICLAINEIKTNYGKNTYKKSNTQKYQRNRIRAIHSAWN